MIYSAALPSPVDAAARSHLLRRDRQEDLCFAIWRPSSGRDRMSALICDLVLPERGDRLVHGNASFQAKYFERALSVALRAKCGIAFLHSHPAPGWQGMSSDDVRAEERLASRVKAATQLPVVGLTLGTDGAWSSRFWIKTGPKQYVRHWCTTTRVVGERLAVTYNDHLLPVPEARPQLMRTVSAWGAAAQASLARLRVGIIGAGSVGCIVAEALARMGIGHIRIMDFDSVEIHNLDRLLYATRRDITIAKVYVVARALRQSATASPSTIEPLEYSIVEEEGFRAALDCDALFSCVDRPWPRSALNFIAYSHLIPVVDGGVAIRASKSGAGLTHADMRAHIAAPTRRCLECLGQYNSGLVSTERDGYLDDPRYIAGLPSDHPMKRNENVFAFGLGAAAFELFQMLSLVIAPLGLSNLGAQLYHFVNGRMEIEPKHGCEPSCFYNTIVAAGDTAGIKVTAAHKVAERARQSRRSTRAVLRHLAWRFGW